MARSRTETTTVQEETVPKMPDASPEKAPGNTSRRTSETSDMVNKVKRKKLSAFGNTVKSLLDPIIVPIVDEHWGLASILIITLMNLLIIIAGAALQVVLPAGTPGTFLQMPYDFLKNLGPSDHVLYTVICAAVLYTFLCGTYTLLDTYRGVYVQENMMIQPRPAGDFGDPETLGLWRTIVTSCHAYKYLTPILILVCINKGPHTYTAPWVTPCLSNCTVKLPDAAPSVLEFVVHFWVSIALNDVTYWYFHWMCHRHRALYKNIHSLHHEYHQPFAMVSAHLHPIEFIATYLFALLPPIACRAHPFTQWIMVVIGTTIGVEAHSGYQGSPFSWIIGKITFGLYGGTEHHDIHHQTPWVNYEPYFGYLDWLCGTGAVIVQDPSEEPAEKKES